MVELQNGSLKGKMSSEVEFKGKVGMAPGGGTQFHSSLVGRDEPNSHPMEAVTNLTSTLEHKINDTDALTNRDIENLLKLFV